MEELVLCTGNPGKVAELRELLPNNITLLSLAEVGLPLDLPETGSTLEENALQKARFAFERTGLPCVADDTGLEVHALGGAPGVRSARYAGDQKDNAANMTRLLVELDGTMAREARFRTVLALVTPQDTLLFEGVVDGSIAHAPRGEHGFGYDPVFVPEGCSETFAELPRAIKNSMSHRGRAVQLLAAHLGRT